VQSLAKVSTPPSLPRKHAGRPSLTFPLPSPFPSPVPAQIKRVWDATWPNDHFLRELQVRLTRIATTHHSPLTTHDGARCNVFLTYPSAPSAQLFERELGLGLAQTDVLSKVRAISLPRPTPTPCSSATDPTLPRRYVCCNRAMSFVHVS